MPGVNLAGQLSAKVSLEQEPVNFMHDGHSPTNRATDERNIRSPSHRPMLLINVCVVPKFDARVHAHNRVMGVSLSQVSDPLGWGRSTSQETKLGG